MNNQTESPPTSRGWLNIPEAAAYVGISKDVIREAIKGHELKAYQKPVSRSRKATNRLNQRMSYRISREDLDAWVRTWEAA